MSNSRHEGVSCDNCLKGNFRGCRYKCLICYDYDLCAACYEAGNTTNRHTTDHPMQCILTRLDFDLFYGGESVSHEQPQAFTCPFCGKMGFTETNLHEHVTSDHSDTSFEVVCPICAALPVGDPNHLTDDFATHLTLEHRPGTSRELEEGSSSRPGVRRIVHPGRGVGGGRVRRSNMPFRFGVSQCVHNGSSNSNSGSSTGLRESVDPIAELLSQLSGVRRNTTASSQLQQLQVQLQLERQQAQSARQQLERWPRRQPQNNSSNLATGTAAAEPAQSSATTSHQHQPKPPSQFLLSKCLNKSLSETELEASEVDRANRAQFIQELMLASLASPPPETTPPPPNPRLSPAPVSMPSQNVTIASRKCRDYNNPRGSVARSNTRGGFRKSGPKPGSVPQESRNQPSEPPPPH